MRAEEVELDEGIETDEETETEDWLAIGAAQLRSHPDTTRNPYANRTSFTALPLPSSRSWLAHKRPGVRTAISPLPATNYKQGRPDTH